MAFQLSTIWISLLRLMIKVCLNVCYSYGKDCIPPVYKPVFKYIIDVDIIPILSLLSCVSCISLSPINSYTKHSSHLCVLLQLTLTVL